nr:MAG TPA: hypothetical protein [Caudoviricetes sp.]
MLPLKYTLKTTAKTTQNIIYEKLKFQRLKAACSRFSILLRASAAAASYAGSTATSAQERYEQRTAFGLYGVREDAVYYGTAFTATRMARSCDELGGQKSASVRGGARFGIFLRRRRKRERAKQPRRIMR